jgi:putative ABC transport system ATP-binding protein
MIKISNLYKKYDVKPIPIEVLTNLNLEIKQGDFVVVFGPSGSGKSTLLNIILGLERPTNGEVIFSNLDVSHASAEKLAEFRKQNIGIVYQQPYWIKSLDVVGNVAFPLTLRGISYHEACTKAMEVLNKVGMARWSNLKPMELSAGQQQKVSLARALITNPSVIIADEPTGNLDYRSGQNLTYYLRALNDSGKTIIMVTHNLDNLDYAKRLVRILDGKIVEDIALDPTNVQNVKKGLIDSNKDVQLNSVNPIPKAISFPEQEKMNIEKDRFNIFGLISWIPSIIKILFLSLLTLIYYLIQGILSIRLLNYFTKPLLETLKRIYYSLTNFIGHKTKDSISYADIFNISFKNMLSKKYRAFLTIGGIALGIGFTSFLVSLGYGMEQLIIQQVTQLNELKQIDVYPSLGDSVALDSQSLEVLKDFNHIERILPVIGIAGNVNYEDSNTDIVVYGVQADYLKESQVELIAGDYFTSNVLGASYQIDLTKNNISTDNSTIEIALPNSTEKNVVVNKAFLDLIGLDTNSATSKTFKLSYIVLEGITDIDMEVRSLANDYTIVGVINADDTPVIYAPISDIQAMGIPTYSQIRLIMQDQEFVPEIREQLNVLGYRTTSVLDTVNQIEEFFASTRIVFALVGMVALLIASLGMFNTLTVSLLERIREVGLMKAIGMKSIEVKELFLTEAVIMGILGGFFGLILGNLGGLLVSSGFSLLAMKSGIGYLNLVYLPPATALLILSVAALTGIATGLYPAKRATRISPLDAFKYE